MLDKVFAKRKNVEELVIISPPTTTKNPAEEFLRRNFFSDLNAIKSEILQEAEERSLSLKGNLLWKLLSLKVTGEEDGRQILTWPLPMLVLSWRLNLWKKCLSKSVTVFVLYRCLPSLFKNKCSPTRLPRSCVSVFFVSARAKAL